MPKPIFDFNAEFKLGIDAVDQEHMRLVEMLNTVQGMISEGKKDSARQYFNETLSAYVDEHFSNEEKYMQSIGFPGLEEHHKIHENFKQSFIELKPRIENSDEAAFRAALSDTFTWIINHIGKTDKKYAVFVNSIGK